MKISKQGYLVYLIFILYAPRWTMTSNMCSTAEAESKLVSYQRKKARFRNKKIAINV